MSVQHCTIDDALFVVERLGVNVADMGLLASALERPRTDVFGVEAYAGPHLKAAALLDAINRAHALDDGNKRLSWILTAVFYELNGWDLFAGPDDGESFVLRVAGDHLDLNIIAAWLEAHVTALP